MSTVEQWIALLVGLLAGLVLGVLLAVLAVWVGRLRASSPRRTDRGDRS